MLIEERLLNGIEVVNETMVSEEALRIALDHGLTIMGTSDVHGLVDWEFEVPGGGHRPITLVFAEERTRERWKPEFQLRFRVLNALNFTENAPNVDTDRPHPIAGVRRSSFVPVAHQFSAGWSSSARACTRSGTRSTRSKIQNCATNTRQRRLACLSDVPRDQVVSGKLAPPSCQTLTCVNLF